MDVSVIIVNWNVRDFLRDCLRSVYQQTRDIAFEIIVVDNASSDGSVEMLKREFPQVKLLDNSENKGFAAASNQGMAIAKGRYFLLLNPDTVILDNAIAKTVAFADKRSEAAVTACRVLSQDGSLQRTCSMYPSLLNMFLEDVFLSKIFAKNHFFGRERMTWWQYDDVREVDVVAGSFMLVRKEAIDKVGVMDERFFMYSEDTDWCYRFKNAGWKIVFTPVSKIVHCGDKSSEQARLEMGLQLRGSNLLFMKKHKNTATYALACFLVGLFFFLRMPYWLGVAIISKKKRKEAFLRAKMCLVGIFSAWTGGKRLLMKGVENKDD